LFERALSLDAHNVRALIGLAGAITWRVNQFWSDDPAGDIERAEKTIDEALALQPFNSSAHGWKSLILYAKRQWGPAIAEAETAIAQDPNNAGAYANAGFFKMFLGHAEDGFAGLETALRLSPRDPLVPNWQSMMCHLHANLAQWEQAIEWGNKSIAGNPRNVYALVVLAAANAWAGRENEAKEAVAQLQKLYPGITVRAFASPDWSDNPTFLARGERFIEGLLKAGLPEGQAKTN
jgi:adenylate cyclase